MNMGGGVPFFLDILRRMDNLINESVRSLLGENFSISVLIILLAASFLYGIVHSIGPGHGKTLVASFFLKEKHPLKKSLILAGIISLIHSGSAIILSFLLYFVLTGIKGMFRIQLQSYFMAASGILIVIIGILFLVLKIVKRKRPNPSEEESGNNGKGSKNSNLILIGISAGIVPCPAALMLMLLTLPQGGFVIGLLSVLAISLGMFSLLTGIGLISIKSRDGILFVSGKLTKRTELVATILEFVSIGLILLIGLSMSLTLVSNMLAPSPF